MALFISSTFGISSILVLLGYSYEHIFLLIQFKYLDFFRTDFISTNCTQCLQPDGHQWEAGNLTKQTI